MWIAPERVAEMLRQYVGPDSPPLRVFWYRTEEPREDVAARLRAQVPDLWVCPLIVQGREFQNPNASPNDFIAALERHRHVVEEIENASAVEGKPLNVVLLSRTNLAIPQNCSPVHLPEWIGRCAGVLLELWIVDLEASPVVTANAVDMRAAEISALLFQLERALQRRLLDRRDRFAIAHSLAARLTGQDESRVSRSSAEQLWEDILSQAREKLATLPGTGMLRLSAKDGKLICERLVRVAADTSPNKMQKVGRELGDLLDVTVAIHQPLSSVMCRGTFPEDDTAMAGRVLATTICAGYHCLNAVSHGERFPLYPVSLLSYVAADVIRSLESAVSELCVT